MSANLTNTIITTNAITTTMIRAKDLADSYMVTWMRVADVTVLSVGALTFSSDPRFSVIHVPRYLHLYTVILFVLLLRICIFPVKSCMHSCVPWQLCQVSAAFQQSCLVKQWKESINKEAQEMLTMPDGYIDDVCSVEFPHNYSTKWDCGVALDSKIASWAHFEISRTFHRVVVDQVL